MEKKGTNYQGYLLKAQGGIVSHRFFQTYKSTPNRQQDKNPWTDGTGETHRNVLPHLRSLIVFTTPPIMLEDKIELQAIFPNRTLVHLEYWNDEINDYCSGKFYIPDVEYEVLMPYEFTIAYRPITFELIEY